MQDALFSPDGPRVDHAKDPYAEDRLIAKRVAAGHGISEEEAFDLVLSFGSERAVARVLEQRWWRGEIDQLGQEAA